MAILQSNGVLLVNSIPTHVPTAEQAQFARLENSLTFYYYNGTAWLTVRLNAPETYTGNIVPDNSDIGTAIQALESAIEAITQDGNHEFITRANATENVAPTSAEVPNPAKGDTADVNLTSGKLEKWIYNTSWSKAFTIDYKDVTNLSYTASGSSGSVTSSTGSSAIIPAVTGANAGLMLPAQKVKVDLITVTQAINLDNIAATLGTALQGVTDTNSINLTKTGNNIAADLKISAVQGSGVTTTVEADGLRVVVAAESKPTGYLSKAAAASALGANKKFRYLAANIDGATENSVAWT